LLYSALVMLKKGSQEIPKAVSPDPLADRLKLHGEYFDNALNRKVAYKVTGVYGGFGMMVVAGVISGLLGIGSGIFKVMAMDLFMKLPLKVSSATSNLFLLVLTPIFRVGVSVILFLKEKDYLYVVITSLVFIILLLGLYLGKSFD
jgi:uncharacterized protein